MHDTDTLRRAAALIRARAQAATPGPWRSEPGARTLPGERPWPSDYVAAAGGPRRFKANSEADAAHIAGWDPPVALTVADWLEAEAAAHEQAEAVGLHFLAETPDGEVRMRWSTLPLALALARAFPGETGPDAPTS